MGFRRVVRAANAVQPSAPNDNHDALAEVAPVEPIPGPADQASDEDTSYKVGKGKPPLHSRWKKGQSGNPAGKKAGTQNSATIAVEIFGEILTVQTPAGPRRMNTVQLAYYKLREMVAKGDLKAIATVLAIWQRIMPDPIPDADGEALTLSASEDALLQGLLDQLGEAPLIKGRVVPAVDIGKGDAS